MTKRKAIEEKRCVRCGRVGTKAFVRVTSWMSTGQAEVAWRCSNREQCQIRSARKARQKAQQNVAGTVMARAATRRPSVDL